MISSFGLADVHIEPIERGELRIKISDRSMLLKELFDQWIFEVGESGAAQRQRKLVIDSGEAKRNIHDVLYVSALYSNEIN
jgi:hypothetical protein